MKAITLHQPHAHLVGLGVKPFETRNWRTDYRGLLAIHAAKIQTNELDGIVLDPNAKKPSYRVPFDRYLVQDWSDYFGLMNHGGIECLAILKGCWPADEVAQMLSHRFKQAKSRGQERRLTEEALAFGNFSPGRWAWGLSIVLRVGGVVGGVVRGYQGLWKPEAALETELLNAFRKTTGERICRRCGCRNSEACVTDGVPCHWVEEFLCSACV